MTNFLEKLRGKTDGTKQAIALSLAFVVTAGIFAVWWTVWYPTYKNDQDKIVEAQKLEPSPWSTFFSSVGESFSAIKNQASAVSSLSNSFFSGLTEPTHYVSTSTEADSVQIIVSTTSAQIGN